MNKSTKIRVNYLISGTISLFLLYCIYKQILKQVNGINSSEWKQRDDTNYLLLSIFLMFVNALLEGSKWYLLSRSVIAISYARAFCSYLAGIAFSLITPNRIGEYPGRILYLGNNVFRYITASVLGITSQLLSIYIFGFLGLIFYNIKFPSLLAKLTLMVCLLIIITGAFIYLRFELYLPRLLQIKWLRKFKIYERSLNKVTTKQKIIILSMSLLRFFVFAAQYLFLLRWMNVNIPLAEGFCMAALFFWILAIVPSVALTELGVRGAVSIYLFQHFSTNSIGILVATLTIWLLNLILPSILGCILIMRMKLLR